MVSPVDLTDRETRSQLLVPMRVGARPFRVMLADPPVLEEHYIYYQPTMGILYLLGALQRAFSPTEVELRYLQGFGDLRDHLDAIEEFQPDLYGISFKTPMARLGYRTLAAVKERFPSMPVIAGGSHVSIMADDVMARTKADACVRGSARIASFGSCRVSPAASSDSKTSRAPSSEPDHRSYTTLPHRSGTTSMPFRGPPGT